MEKGAHKPALDRQALREQADRHTRRSLLRMLVCVSVLRTVWTDLFPAVGSASFWFAPLMMLPGILVSLALDLLMRNRRAPTLQALIRQLLGQAGARALCITIIAALLIDAFLTLRCLTGLFTEGIGTDGTQFTLAVITCGMLLLCYPPDGLPRGIHLLRWAILIMLVILALDWSRQAGADRFSPVLGSGITSLRQSLLGCMSISWSIPLLLIEPPVRPGDSHLRELAMPVLLCCAVSVLIPAAVPHTVFVASSSVTQALLTPLSLLHGGNRTLGICLLMLTLFLLLASEVHTMERLAQAVSLGRPSVIKYALTVVLCLSHLVHSPAWWSSIQQIQRFLLLPFCAAAVCCSLAACFASHRRTSSWSKKH